MRSYSRFNLSLAKRYGQWLMAQHYARGTKYVYNQSLAMFVEFLRHKPLTSVSQLDVRKFMFFLSQNGVSLSRARSHLGALRHFYDFLNLGGLMNYVPPRLMRIRMLPRRYPLHLSEAEVVRLIDATETPRERSLIEFLYGTGCRLGEARALRVQDLDLNARTARVTGKFGKSRVVLLTKRAAAALGNYIDGRKVGYVFQHEYPIQKGYIQNNKGYWIACWREAGGSSHRIARKSLGKAKTVPYEEARSKLDTIVAAVPPARPQGLRQLTNTTLSHGIEDIARRAGLSRATAHMLRHSFATHMFERGADVLTLQTLMGHVCVSSTAIYARPSAFRMVDVFERCHPFGIGSAHNQKGSHAKKDKASIQEIRLGGRRTAHAALVSHS